MLVKENYTREHIQILRDNTNADPSLLERTIFAFGLLEAIRKVGLKFIFKGGSSLLLLLKEPRRLSTDIDIIVEPETNINKYIEEAGKIFPFVSVEEDIRKGINDIEKRHFMFIFESPLNGKMINILLDVVFENNPYKSLVERPIRNDLIITDGNDDYSVKLPDINSILGDKLTAFAPHTTGIEFGKNKELEIIKQMFDCWTLIQDFDNFEAVKNVYDNVSTIEMGYRGIKGDNKQIMLDTIRSCICIIARGAINYEEYKYYSMGIDAIKGHIFKGKINGENAGFYVSEILYFVTCLLTDTIYKKIIVTDTSKIEKIKLKGSKQLNYLRMVNINAYAYAAEAFRLLNDNGYYLDGIE